jgi:Yip1 domain
MQLVKRATAILATPRTEWPVIEGEPPAPLTLFINYVAILAAIPALAGFIGKSLIGGYTPVLTGLLRALIAYLVTIVATYLIACLINLLAPKFGGQRNFGYAVKVAVYAHTPVWLAGVFLLIPGLHFLMLLGLYGLYLLWTGLLLLMRVPSYRVMPYVAVIAACALVPAIVLAVI